MPAASSYSQRLTTATLCNPRVAQKLEPEKRYLLNFYQRWLMHQPPLQATPQHPLLLRHTQTLQSIIILIPVYSPSQAALLFFFNGNQTFLPVQRQSLLIIFRPIPRTNYVLPCFYARAVLQLPRLLVCVYPIELRLFVFGFWSGGIGGYRADKAEDRWGRDGSMREVFSRKREVEAGERVRGGIAV